MKAKSVGTNEFVLLHFAECGLNWPAHDVRNPSNSLYMQENVLYSYGPHYPLARWLGRNTLLVNSDDTTATSNRHKTNLLGWAVTHRHRGMVSGQGAAVFFVTDVLASTPDAHVSNMDDYDARLRQLAGRVLRAREQRQWLQNRLDEMLCTRNSYAEWLRLYQRASSAQGARRRQLSARCKPMCLRDCYLNVRSK